jgi:hypothetical protein
VPADEAPVCTPFLSAATMVQRSWTMAIQCCSSLSQNAAMSGYVSWTMAAFWSANLFHHMQLTVIQPPDAVDRRGLYLWRHIGCYKSRIPSHRPVRGS